MLSPSSLVQHQILMFCVYRRPKSPQNRLQTIPTVHDQLYSFIFMADFNVGFVNLVDMSFAAPVFTFEAKLAAARDEMFAFQHIHKLTLFDLVWIKNPTDMLGISCLDPLCLSDRIVLNVVFEVTQSAKIPARVI